MNRLLLFGSRVLNLIPYFAIITGLVRNWRFIKRFRKHLLDIRIEDQKKEYQKFLNKFNNGYKI